MIEQVVFNAETLALIYRPLLRHPGPRNAHEPVTPP